MNPVDPSITWQTVEKTEPVSYLSRVAEGTFVAGGGGDGTSGLILLGGGNLLLIGGGNLLLIASTVGVANAKRRAPDLQDMQEAGALLASQALVWHVWKSQMGTTVPKERDVVQPVDGSRWTVKSIAVQALAQRYRLTCLRERP